MYRVITGGLSSSFSVARILVDVEGVVTTVSSATTCGTLMALTRDMAIFSKIEKLFRALGINSKKNVQLAVKSSFFILSGVKHVVDDFWSNILRKNFRSSFT